MIKTNGSQIVTGFRLTSCSNWPKLN